jgi:AcrR family transcriptional regulator
MARKRSRISPRKQPQQGRSRDTVEAILQATTYLLLRVGYDAMTTNQIAKRAGVNIASLYQYFPNKQAIVATLMKRHVERTRAAMVPLLEHSRGADTESRVRALVEVMAADHAVEPKLHAIFTALGPQLGFEAVSDADAAIAAERDAWIRAMAGTLPDPALSLWVAQTAIHAVFHAAFIERPDVASRPELVDELVRLVTPYLAPPRHDSGKR